MYAFGARVLQV